MYCEILVHYKSYVIYDCSGMAKGHANYMNYDWHDVFVYLAPQLVVISNGDWLLYTELIKHYCLCRTNMCIIGYVLCLIIVQ